MNCKMCEAKVKGLTIPVTWNEMCDDCKSSISIKYEHETISGKIRIDKSKHNDGNTDLMIFDNMAWVSASVDDLTLEDLYAIRRMFSQRISKIEGKLGMVGNWIKGQL